MKTIISSIFFLFFLAGFFNGTNGQESYGDTLDLKGVVITASKTPTPIGNVTQKIDVLEAPEMIPIVQGNINLTELLQYLPGSSVSVLSRNDANWGTYGGIGPKYFTYMLSGLPLDAFIDPQSLDLQAIGRLEVHRGPASVLYPNYLSQDFAGNQSPLAGTVNLVLKERFETNKTLFSTSAGSFNTFHGQVHHQGSSGRFHYFGGLSYEMSDYVNYGTADSWLNMQDNPEYRKSKLYAGGNLFLGEKEEQKLSFFVNRTRHFGDAGRVYRGFDHNYTTLNTGYSTPLTEQLGFHVHFGLRIYDRTWQESMFNEVDSLLSNNGAYQNILPADANLTFRHGENHLLTVGADYQNAEYYTWSDPLLGYRQYGNKSIALQTGIYAQEELRFNALILRAGLRYNFIRHNIDLVNGDAPGETQRSWSSLIWNGGIKYHLTSFLSLFANAGNSYLTPGLKSIGGTISLDDLGVPGRNGQLPNPDLVPESGLGMDLGADLHELAGMNISLRGFYLLVEDAIVETVISEDPSQTQSVNAGETSSLGAEIDIRHHVNSLFSWFANYTYMQTNIQNPLSEDHDDLEVPFAPEHVANAGMDFVFPFGLTASPYLNYNGGYYDSNSHSGRKKFTPGVVVNVYLAQAISSGKNGNLDIFARLYNITDNRFEMPWQFQNTGFSMMAGFNYTIQ
jgi:outer membrane cobalamin receptor